MNPLSVTILGLDVLLKLRNGHLCDLVDLLVVLGDHLLRRLLGGCELGGQDLGVLSELRADILQERDDPRVIVLRLTSSDSRRPYSRTSR